MLIQALRTERDYTLSQLKLNVVVDRLAKVGGITVLVLLFIDIVKFLVELRGSLLNAKEKGLLFLKNLLVILTTSIFAMPGGLPLSVLQVHNFVISRHAKSNIIVRAPEACEAMGNVTTICINRTPYLTQNRKKVVVGMLGAGNTFYDEGTCPAHLKTMAATSTFTSFFSKLSEETITLLRSCITFSSCTFEEISQQGERLFIGSETESALLRFARSYLSTGNPEMQPHASNIIQLEPFTTRRKLTACVMKLENEKGAFYYRLYLKGASKVLLKHVTRVIDSSLGTSTLTFEDRRSVEQTILNFSSHSLDTIVLCFRDFESWPPEHCMYDSRHVQVIDLLDDMTLISVVSIEDPLRHNIQNDITTCINAGIFPRLVTGVDILVAKHIASDCGIFTPGGIIMEGSSFLKLNSAQQKQILPRLQVLARSTPESKRVLVSTLCDYGETVAVTGDDGADISALKSAKIGLSSMKSSDMAKEASSILFNDDGFISILRAIAWGRSVTNLIRRILQV